MLDRVETWVERSYPTIAGGIRVAIVLACLGAIAWLAGCDSPVRANAQAASLVAELHVTAGDEIDLARDRALDAVEEAHPNAGPERNAALDAEAQHWRPVGVALDTLRAAVLTWTEAIALAHASGSDLSLERILRLAARAVEMWDTLVLAAQEIGIDDLPRLPEAVRALARAVQ